MGTESDRKLAAQDARRVKAEKKRMGRLAAFTAATHSTGADWSSCDAELLKDVVVLITNMGGAVILGMSRDQGAHSLTLMLDGNRKSLWFDGDAELDDKLQEVIGKLQAQS